MQIRHQQILPFLKIQRELKSVMIHRILKTAIHPLAKFIFEYLFVLPLPAAKKSY
jgi:hypothetical protein